MLIFELKLMNKLRGILFTELQLFTEMILFNITLKRRQSTSGLYIIDRTEITVGPRFIIRTY